MKLDYKKVGLYLFIFFYVGGDKIVENQFLMKPHFWAESMQKRNAFLHKFYMYLLSKVRRKRHIFFHTTNGPYNGSQKYGDAYKIPKVSMVVHTPVEEVFVGLVKPQEQCKHLWMSR